MPDATDATVTVTIDGAEIEVPAGTNLIEAARSAGVEIPHYCYHPGLSVAGNCRMCLVQIEGMPKPAIACNTPATDGMVVHTGTPEVEEMRRAVLEFLLINHPLDCPICDKAGECRLQEYSVDHGQGSSRFTEEKVHKPKRVDLGSKIVLDVERCILCSRCIRFCREVAGDDVLGFVDRGGHTELSVFPGRELENNYALNTVDICPVGALTSKDFRFRMRVWFLKSAPSICPGCATGCNIHVDHRDGTIYRLRPRENLAVNRHWMCDMGRLNYRFTNREDRLGAPAVRAGDGELGPRSWDDALDHAADGLRAIRAAHGGDAIAAIGSARATCEELALFRAMIVDGLGTGHVDVVPRDGEGDDILLSADRNPNTAGARVSGIAADPPGSVIESIRRGIDAGEIRALVSLGENVAEHGIPAETLARLDLLVATDILPSATTGAAHVVLPGAACPEKTGTFINGRGRVQRFLAGIPRRGEALPEWRILAGLNDRLGVDPLGGSPAKVFARFATDHLRRDGFGYSDLGDNGTAIDDIEELAAQGRAELNRATEEACRS